MSSKAVTWSRPESCGRRRSGSPTGVEGAPTDRPRATEALKEGRTKDERLSEQRRLIPLGQAFDQPRRFSEGRTVDPLVRTLRAAGWHHDVAALAPHVEPRAEQSRAVADLRAPRVAEEDVNATSPSARPSRLRGRSSSTLKLREAF